MTMDQSEFETIADRTLEGFMETIDENLGDRLDVDMEGGILTIELDSGGQYVINKHAPNRQIWMSSPISGACHFSYDADRKEWMDTRGGFGLSDLLAKELEAATGAPITL